MVDSLALQLARRLVVEDGYTYAEAADAAGISESWVKKAAADQRWQEAREAHELHQVGYQARIRLLKANLLKKAVDASTAAEVDANKLKDAISMWRQMETAYPDRLYRPPEANPEARRRAQLEFFEALIQYATEQDTNLLAALEPHIERLGQMITEAAHG